MLAPGTECLPLTLLESSSTSFLLTPPTGRDIEWPRGLLISWWERECLNIIVTKMTSYLEKRMA